MNDIGLANKGVDMPGEGEGYWCKTVNFQIFNYQVFNYPIFVFLKMNGTGLALAGADMPGEREGKWCKTFNFQTFRLPITQNSYFEGLKMNGIGLADMPGEREGYPGIRAVTGMRDKGDQTWYVSNILHQQILQTFEIFLEKERSWRHIWPWMLIFFYSD